MCWQCVCVHFFLFEMFFKSQMRVDEIMKIIVFIGIGFNLWKKWNQREDLRLFGMFACVNVSVHDQQHEILRGFWYGRGRREKTVKNHGWMHAQKCINSIAVEHRHTHTLENRVHNNVSEMVLFSPDINTIYFFHAHLLWIFNNFSIVLLLL